VTHLPARPEWKALQTVQARARADVRLTSPEMDWNAIAASRFRLGQVDVALPPLGVPAIGINYGRPLQLERTLYGRRLNGTVISGQLALLPPDTDTRWIFDKTGDIVIVCLSRDLLNKVLEDGAGRDPRSVEIVPRFLIRDLVVERIIHQLLKEICEPRPESRLTAELLAQELARHLVDAHSTLAQRPSGKHTMAPRKVARTIEFMRANLSRQITLQDLADAAGMSLYHFAKSFKQATGCAPHHYLTEQRLYHARGLLHDARLSIGDVAAAVGLTHSHFTVVFARQMGMPPSEFREVLRA
jgi:AraC family transcriptional regulator